MLYYRTRSTITCLSHRKSNLHPIKKSLIGISSHLEFRTNSNKLNQSQPPVTPPQELPSSSKVRKAKLSLGIDSPAVVRNLYLGSIFQLLLTGTLFRFHESIVPSSLFPTEYVFQVALWSFAGASVLCALSACHMIYTSLIKKPDIVSNLMFNHLNNLKGNEKVLDVGCGNGILLVELGNKLLQAAEQSQEVPTFRLIGIDIWSDKDQTGNTMLKTQKNIKDNNLGNFTQLLTGDMRHIPCQDERFDLVVSSLAIHNLDGQMERVRALKEIMRVLKPGGQLVIWDIFSQKEYLQFFKCNPDKVKIESTTNVFAFAMKSQIIKCRKL